MKFEGTPGEWDINTDENTILSNAGYVVAEIALVNGTKEDVYMMAASKAMYDSLNEMIGSLGVMVTDADSCPEIIKARAAIAKAIGKGE